MDKPTGLHDRIYDVVRRIPHGRVATYGQIASIVGRCTPRMVGYALAAMPFWEDFPWQRVVNSQGKMSLRTHGTGHLDQRRLLEQEGVVFSANARIDLRIYGYAAEDAALEDLE